MGGFASGFDLGNARAEAQQQHKRALSDEEHEQALADKNNTIQTIQQKLSQTDPNHPDYAGLQNQLQQVTADRTALFHPDQPGGLHRLGKMLWERVHGKQPGPTETTTFAPQYGGQVGGATLPALPATSVTHAATTPADLKARAVQELGWGAPADPLQAQSRLADFNRQQEGLNQDWKLDWAKRHGVSGEALDELTEQVAGLTASKLPKPLTGAKPYKGADGKYYIAMQDPLSRSITAMEMPPDYQPPAPNLSNAQMPLAIRAHFGKDLSAMSPDESEAAINWYQQTIHPPTVTTREGIQFDAKGNPYQVQTSTESAKLYGSAGDLRKRAASVLPGVSVSATPLPNIHRNTPDQTTADKGVSEAVKLDSLANQMIASQDPSQQKQTALALIKAMAGRVNMQEYQIYTQGYGVENTVEGLIQGIENGGLAPGIVQQLANDAHAFLKASKDAQANAYGSSSNNPAAKKGRKSLKAAMALAMNKGKTEDQVRADLQAHGYEVAP